MSMMGGSATILLFWVVADMILLFDALDLHYKLTSCRLVNHTLQLGKEKRISSIQKDNVYKGFKFSCAPGRKTAAEGEWLSSPFRGCVCVMLLSC